MSHCRCCVKEEEQTLCFFGGKSPLLFSTYVVRTLDRAKDDTYLQSNKVNLVHIESRSSKRKDGAYQGRSLNFHFDFVALGVRDEHVQNLKIKIME